MYEAKRAGRNAVRFFDPFMQKALERRARLEAGLRQALSNEEFSLHYQIQVDRHGRRIGAEALIRWQHPEDGLISPAQFIPVAEETGLIMPIGKWVLESACARIKAWERQSQTRALTLAVNVSACQFRQPEFVEQVKAAIERNGIDPARLKLELTESLVVSNVEDTIAKMLALKSVGVRFSMDDFGTGHSSLSYLKLLPLDQLKIDRSFVHDIVTDPSDAIIVQTIINMGRTLGLNVIAEGVETEEQRRILIQHGCEAFQGYLFGRPVPAVEFEHLLAAA
jgi:EAL domain-containing protein (putative c-di-GMP-specific phosphodiesterase class I)